MTVFATDIKISFVEINEGIEEEYLISRLFDLYGRLLSRSQADALLAVYNFDLSLSEAAENEGISRQAVHTALRSACRALKKYETALHLKQRFENISSELDKIRSMSEANMDILSSCDKIEEEIWGKSGSF